MNERTNYVLSSQFISVLNKQIREECAFLCVVRWKERKNDVIKQTSC